MLRRILQTLGRNRKRTAGVALLASLALLNVLAYNHARAMTHYDADADGTPSPEALSIGQKVKALLLGVQVPRPRNQNDPGSVGLSFDTLMLPGSDGITLEVWRCRVPAPRGSVVLVHGYAASKASLLGEARAFADLGYDVYLVDCRGSGGSSGHCTSIGVYEADDVARVATHLQETAPGRPVILYGQSMGAAAILRAIAAQGVRPSAVILEFPFDRLLTTVGNRFGAMGLPAFPGAELLVFWGGVQQGFNGFHHNPADYARNVDCPVLLFHGGQDTRVLPDQAEAVFDAFTGPKRRELFAEAGHVPCRRVDAERWQRAVAEFLRENVS